MTLKIDDFVPKLKFPEPKPLPKIKPEPPRQEQSSGLAEKRQTLAFQGDLTKFKLNQFLPPGGGTTPAAKPPSITSKSINRLTR